MSSITRKPPFASIASLSAYLSSLLLPGMPGHRGSAVEPSERSAAGGLPAIGRMGRGGGWILSPRPRLAHTLLTGFRTE